MSGFSSNQHFEFSNGREMVECDRAVELLNEVSNLTDPVSIKLSNKSFSVPASSIIGERFKCN